MKLSIITNSTPIIAFSKKREIALLHQLLGTILIPEGVLQELLNVEGSSSDQQNQVKEGLEHGWFQVASIPKERLKVFPLGKGETEVINLGLITPNALLLMDEKKGRLIAQANHLKVLGTLGLLILLVKKKLQDISEVKQNLKKLLDSGFYLDSDVILTFLANLELL